MISITPFLWYDNEALDAVRLYTSIFPNSTITSSEILENTPSGNVPILSFNLLGKEFSAMSGGPFHKFNPSISFVFISNNVELAETTWKKISKGGQILMDYMNYPFAEKFGWTQDKFGLSWQVQYDPNVSADKIVSNLMFVGNICGKAEEAMNFYTDLFKNSEITNIQRFTSSELPDKEGTIKHATFSIEKRDFGIQDSAHAHNFGFNESMSFVINCETQEELDYYWDNLTAEPKAEQCGWLKDKFGISWQVVPTGFNELMKDPDKKKVKRITQAFLKMKKIDLKTLQNIT